MHLRPRIRQAAARFHETDADGVESREQQRDLRRGVGRQLGRDQADAIRQACWVLAHRLQQHADVVRAAQRLHLHAERGDGVPVRQHDSHGRRDVGVKG